MTDMRERPTGGRSDLPPMLRKHFPKDQTRILVIEDDQDHAGLIEAVFATRLAHTEVDVAFSGQQAREYLLERDPPALVTLALSLADDDGLEILEWMGGDDRFADLPVIVFTSSTDPEDAKRAYSLGARRYLEKPADFGGLVTAIKAELNRWIEPERSASSA